MNPCSEQYASSPCRGDKKRPCTWRDDRNASSPSLVETDDGSSTTSREDHFKTLVVATRLFPKLPQLTTSPSTRKRKGKVDASLEWWGRLQSLACCNVNEQLDHVLEESSVNAGLAERNAYSMKQALEEWKITEKENEESSKAIMEEDQFKEGNIDSDCDSEDDDEDDFFDALEYVTVTSSVGSLADVADEFVKTTARVALEESSLQATVAEQTAREMQQAMAWWKQSSKSVVKEEPAVSEQEKEPLESFANDIMQEVSAFLILHSSKSRDFVKELQNANRNTSMLQENKIREDSFLLNAEDYQDVGPSPSWRGSHENDHDDDLLHTSLEDTNIMEAHLVAQEQTCEVEMLCYETKRMAEEVAHLLKEGSDTPRRCSSLVPWLKPSAGLTKRQQDYLTTRMEKEQLKQRRLMLKCFLMVILVGAWGKFRKKDDVRPSAPEETMIWLPNEFQPTCPWVREFDATNFEPLQEACPNL